MISASSAVKVPPPPDGRCGRKRGSGRITRTWPEARAHNERAAVGGQPSSLPCASPPSPPPQPHGQLHSSRRASQPQGQRCAGRAA
eukprot:5025951-Prymnesium_polylepis.1